MGCDELKIWSVESVLFLQWDDFPLQGFFFFKCIFSSHYFLFLQITFSMLEIYNEQVIISFYFSINKS